MPRCGRTSPTGCIPQSIRLRACTRGSRGPPTPRHPTRPTPPRRPPPPPPPPPPRVRRRVSCAREDGAVHVSREAPRPARGRGARGGVGDGDGADDGQPGAVVVAEVGAVDFKESLAPNQQAVGRGGGPET